MIFVVGGGSGPTKVMTQGQVSNASNYMTATFNSSISGYYFVLVKLFRAGAEIATSFALVPTNSVAFTITGSDGREYSMVLRPASISCTYYSGSYADLFVDVWAYPAL